MYLAVGRWKALSAPHLYYPLGLLCFISPAEHAEQEMLMLAGNPEKTQQILGYESKKIDFPQYHQAKCCDCRGRVTEPLIRLLHIVSSGALEVTEPENS